MTRKRMSPCARYRRRGFFAKYQIRSFRLLLEKARTAIPAMDRTIMVI